MKEYPILMQPTALFSNGMVTTNIPDRVIFSAEQSKIGGKQVLTITYCGVIRHGPGQNFLSCT